MSNHRIAAKLLLLLMMLAASGCSAPAANADFVRLDADIEPLRAAFNAAEGKVRVLMLLAPS